MAVLACCTLAAQAPAKQPASKSRAAGQPVSGAKSKKSGKTSSGVAPVKTLVAPKKSTKVAAGKAKALAGGRTTGKKPTVSAKSRRAAANASPRQYGQMQPTPDRYKEIQRALVDKGYFHGQIDGNWGADSADAMKRFQADQDLDADGKLSSLSIIALGLGPRREGAESKTASGDASGTTEAPATASETHEAGSSASNGETGNSASASESR